jgi:hypothetical protein
MLAATNTATPPMLLPLPELAESRGGAPADTKSAAIEPRESARGDERSDKPGLPFTGFSLLALALAGIASITAGRRLQSASAPRAFEPPDPEPVLAVAPAPAVAASVRRPRREHTAIFAAAGLVALAAFAAARSR